MKPVTILVFKYIFLSIPFSAGLGALYGSALSFIDLIKGNTAIGGKIFVGTIIVCFFFLFLWIEIIMIYYSSVIFELFKASKK